ncbi:MAG TPA: hypothetical protein PLG22_07170 [Kiritimatiellia bacterium]|nr:hypothetical protein [Kiritimatiellia bacterium]
MNALEFVVRMRDEATARLQAFRSSLRDTAKDSKNTTPALSDMENAVAKTSRGYAQAARAIMSVVGVVGMVTGVFTTCYRAVLPLGEYIRRMWDPVERGAENFRKMEAVIEKTAAATQKKLEAQRAAVQAIADAYEKAIAVAGRYYDSFRRASAAGKTSLSPDEALLNMREASYAAGQRQSQIGALQGQREAVLRAQAANAQKYPRQMDPEQKQEFLLTNEVFQKAIANIDNHLSDAMVDADLASREVSAAYAEYDQARVNEAREDVARQNGEIEKAKREKLEGRAKAGEKTRETIAARLTVDKDAAASAWEEYLDPSKRRARLESEAGEKKAKEQFAQDKRDFIEKYGISIWGAKKFDESRLGQSARDAMTDREKSVLEVMKAQERQASDETVLKEIAASTKKTADDLAELLRLK